jgi:hypothetical protein
MWFPNANALNTSNPATSFVALRWHEFFDAFTPDSFQPRVCHLPTIVEELAVVSANTVMDSRHRFHLQQVQAELKQLLGGIVEKEACSFKEAQLLRSIMESENALFVRDTANHLLHDGLRKQFEDRLLMKGQSAIEAALTGKKSEKELAEIWLGSWATLALHRNYLQRDDAVVFDEALLGQSLGDTVGLIRSKLDPVENEYDCVVELRLTAEVLNLEVQQGKEVLDQLQAVLRKVVGELPAQNLVGEVQADRLLVHRKIKAVGRKAALSEFVSILQPALNLLDLYRNGPTVREIRDGWTGTRLTNLAATKIQENALQKLHPRKKAAELTINALNEREVVGHVDAYIANALELYHVAMTTEDRRVRFLTLWSAMECLAHTVDGATTMERVAKLVGSIVVWRRIEKHLRYIAINLKFQRDWQPALKATPIAGLPNANDNRVCVEDVLESLTKPDRDLRLTSLGGHCASHPLLLWRVNCCWKSFHSVENLRGDLRASRARLEWQIGRIYRARNTLVHQGAENPLLSHLSNHLQFYFSTTISRLLHGLAEKSDKNSRDAAFRWCAHYEYVLDRLTYQPDHLSVADLLPTPERSQGVRPWAKP